MRAEAMGMKARFRRATLFPRKAPPAVLENTKNQLADWLKSVS